MPMPQGYQNSTAQLSRPSHTGHEEERHVLGLVPTEIAQDITNPPELCPGVKLGMLMINQRVASFG